MTAILTIRILSKQLRLLLLSFFFLAAFTGRATKLLIPMDGSQSDHLKAYGIAYWTLQNEVPIEWLLNYRGGSFMCQYNPAIQNELVVRGVSFEIISDAQANQIITEISSPDFLAGPSGYTVVRIVFSRHVPSRKEKDEQSI